MAFEKIKEQSDIVKDETGIKESAPEESFDLKEISGRVKELQEMPDLTHKKRLERNEESIEISHLIIEYLLNASEEEAKKLWENLDPSFKKEKMSGILAETAFLRLLKELKLEEAHSASAELDSKNGIDFIGKENGKMGLFQVKGRNVLELENLMREKKLEIDDLIIPLPVENTSYKNFIEDLTKKPVEAITKKMRSGGGIIREERNYTGKISCFFVIIPSGKALKANGELAPGFKKEILTERLKNVTGIAG